MVLVKLVVEIAARVEMVVAMVTLVAKVTMAIVA